MFTFFSNIYSVLVIHRHQRNLNSRTFLSGTMPSTRFCQPHSPFLFLPCQVIMTDEAGNIVEGQFLWTDSATRIGQPKTNHPPHDIFEIEGVMYNSVRDAATAHRPMRSSQQAWAAFSVPDDVIHNMSTKLSVWRTNGCLVNTLTNKQSILIK
jgi:hypothetical protein